jgi:hypothetical protein
VANIIPSIVGQALRPDSDKFPLPPLSKRGERLFPPFSKGGIGEIFCWTHLFRKASGLSYILNSFIFTVN